MQIMARQMLIIILTDPKNVIIDEPEHGEILDDPSTKSMLL
jgi:hypothetical protein